MVRDVRRISHSDMRISADQLMDQRNTSCLLNVTGGGIDLMKWWDGTPAVT